MRASAALYQAINWVFLCITILRRIAPGYKLENMKPITIPAVFLSLCLLFTIASCRKKTDCVARVYCQDENGKAVSNAGVQLYATVRTSGGSTVQADMKANSSTDGNGITQFTFKLPAIYDIKATASVGSKTITGSGIVKLEEGQTVERSVTLR